MELLEQQEYLIEEDNLGEWASWLVEIWARDKTIWELTNRELLDTLGRPNIGDVKAGWTDYRSRTGAWVNRPPF